MWAQFGSLSVVPWMLLAQMSGGLDAVPAITAAQPTSGVTAEVRDRGGMFSRGAERQAHAALRRVQRDHRVPILVETIESLEGAWVADVAGRRARAADPEQLYILVAGSERDVGVIAARHGPASRLSDQQRETIRRAFLGPLQAGETDGALEQGVGAIGTTLAAASGPKPTARYALCSLTILLAFLLASEVRGRYRVTPRNGINCTLRANEGDGGKPHRRATLKTRQFLPCLTARRNRKSLPLG